MNSLPNAHAYPKTRRVDAVAGVEDALLEDPYQWLEDDTAEVLTWQSAQNQMASEYIRSWPHFNTVREAVLPYAEGHWTPTDEPPVFAGNRWFSMAIPEGQVNFVVQASTAPATPGRTVVDPSLLTDDDGAMLTGFSPSPDGRLIACWIASAGDERVVLHVVDVETGAAVLPPSTSRFDANGASVAWLADGSGFYCNPLSDEPGRYGPQVVFQRMDGTAELEISDLDLLMVKLVVAADGKHVLVIDPVDHKPVRIKSLPDGTWQPLLASATASFFGTAVEDAFFAVTTDGAPRGRLVRIPLSSADDKQTWSELVPESSVVLTAVTYRAGVLILHELVDTYSRLRLVGLDGAELGEIALPEPGTAGTLLSLMAGDLRPGGSRYIFPFVSFTTGQALYEFDVEARELRMLVAPRHRITGMTTRIERCTAPDGTPLTYDVVHRADLDLARPHPVLAHAYGAVRTPWLPMFLGEYQAFLAAGGIYVHPHVRGGGEYGEDFFINGTLEHKQNTFNDLHTIAEDLIAKKITEARRIGIVGSSAGGLLAGVAATQRPDLYGVCIPRVPLLDLLRVVNDPYGLAAVTMLFGDPTTSDGVRHLATFSPYHLIREGTAYPAVLLMCGETDHRCPAWHGRKTAARLQSASSSEAPVLLRIWSDAGHGTGTSMETQGEQLAEWMSFAMMELGLAPSVPSTVLG